jgi:micrococcal nuclease
MKEDFLYHYKALVTSVYDGDTITVDLQLGCDVVLRNQKIRLYGINTPELRGDSRNDGLAARDFLREYVLNKTVTLKTIKDKSGKYGRLLGIIYTDEKNINELLISEGYAKKY